MWCKWLAHYLTPLIQRTILDDASKQTVANQEQAVCYTSMLQKFASLGCTSDSPACLCKNPDFAFGMRDCALQACGAQVASDVAVFASALCASRWFSHCRMLDIANSL